jgi:hypothetical protein
VVAGLSLRSVHLVVHVLRPLWRAPKVSCALSKGYATA